MLWFLHGIAKIKKMDCYLLLCLFSFVFPSYSGCNVKRYICTYNSSVYTIQTFGQQRSERQVNIGSKTWQGWTKGTFPRMFKPSVFDCTYFHLRTLWTLCGHFGPFGWVQYVRRYLFPSADTLDPFDGSNMSADTYFHLRTLCTLCGHFGSFGWVQYVLRYTMDLLLTGI